MEQKFIVTIGREFGTGGRQIAIELADLLGVKLYDRRLLEQLQERYNLTAEEIDKIKAKKKSWWDDFARMYHQTTAAWNEMTYYETSEEKVSSEKLYADEEFILRSLAEQESCVVLGRTGFHIFRENPNAFKVFLIADMDFRRNKVARRLNINEGSADLLIKKVDNARENFTKTFSGKSRYDARNYDLVLNVSGLDSSYVAQFLAKCVEQRMNR